MQSAQTNDVQSSPPGDIQPTAPSAVQATVADTAQSNPRNENPQSKREIALASALQIAEAFSSAAAGCGVVGVESAAGLLKVVIQQIQTVRENAENCKKLIAGIDNLLNELNNISAVNLPPKDGQATIASRGSEDTLKTRVTVLRTALLKIKRGAETLTARTSGKGLKAFIKRFLFAIPNKLLVDSMAKDVEEATRSFAFSNGIATVSLLQDIQKDIVRQNVRKELQVVLGHRELASHEDSWKSDPIRGPYKGTRVELLDNLNLWATSPAEEKCSVYVLTGDAGTGKTTITYSVAESARQRRAGGQAGQLAAEFFFQHSAAGRSTATVVLPALTLQMLADLSDLESEVTTLLREYGSLGMLPTLEKQGSLFSCVLQRLRPDHLPVVIVIDAVDECSTAEVQTFLDLLIDAVTRTRCSTRVLITLRRDVLAHRALDGALAKADEAAGKEGRTKAALRRHHLDTESNDDIETYLGAALEELDEPTRKCLFEAYQKSVLLNHLTTLSGGLFIYAATLIGHLHRHNGMEILRAVEPLYNTAVTTATPVLARLSDLYTSVLTRALPPNVEGLPALGAKILGAIVVLRAPISPRALAALGYMDLKRDLEPTLERLAPVLRPDPIQHLHSTFIEFLGTKELGTGDPKRSNVFHVSSPVYHLEFAQLTLGLLRRPNLLEQYAHSLKPPSEVQSSNSKLPVIDSELTEFLHYACLYWPCHVVCYLDSPPTRPQPLTPGEQLQVDELVLLVSDFCVPELVLPWIEILCRLKKLETAIQWLPRLRRLFSSQEHHKSMSDTLRDVYQLVVTFYPALVEHPRHIYTSALPQCPGTSPLRTRISPALPVPRSLLPYPEWPPWVIKETKLPEMTPPMDPYRWLVQPSPDGQWVAASLRGPDLQGDIHLRDATTGIILRTLHVHSSELVDFGISADSQFIVSATSYGEICITDCGSSIVVVRYNHTDGDVARVAFRCKDSELILVHTPRKYDYHRPVRFLILDWDRTERMEGELRPRWESHRIRKDTRHQPQPWSISPDGRWGVLWATGDLLDLHSFDEAQLPSVPNQNTVGRDPFEAVTCGTWLSATSLVCSIPYKEESCLIVVDIGKEIAEIKMQLARSLPTTYKFIAMKSCASGSVIALHGMSRSGHCICLWDMKGDEIRLLKHVFRCDFCLSPSGEELYLAEESTWSVIPTSPSSIAAAQPIHSSALKFSSTRDAIMATIWQPAFQSEWEVGLLSRGFSSSSGTAGVVSRSYFGRERHVGTASLTPDPQSMILCYREVVLASTLGGIRTFGDSRQSDHDRYPDHWNYASMSPDLSRIIACGVTSDTDLTFAVWDTASANLLHAFTTPRPSLPGSQIHNPEILVTEALDIHYLLGHHSFAFRYSDWSTWNPDEPALSPLPKLEPVLGPVPGEWFQIGDDGWVTRSDGHPEVGKRGRGREKLFWIPPSQRVKQRWRGDQHLLAMTTEYDVIVLDLSDFDDDSKEQHVPRLQIENK